MTSTDIIVLLCCAIILTFSFTTVITASMLASKIDRSQERFK